jgi:hypothetical protein
MSRKVGGEAGIRARIAAAPGLDTQDAHRLAGLLEAEGHLSITPNNGNGWRCSCQVALRDDDRQILEDIRDRTGLGHLNAVPARNGSRPQVVWKVESKLECAALVEILDDHPVRGQKLSQYAIWREATEVWASKQYGLEPAGRVHLGTLAGAIKDARQYRGPGPNARPPNMDDSFAPYYFAGFFSGEGCFLLKGRDARFVIKLRRDDRPLLEAFERVFGIGKVCDAEIPGSWSPCAVWTVVSARDVLVGIDLLEHGGLLGRKKRQFDAWRPGAVAVARAKLAREPEDANVVATARRSLARASAYLAPTKPLCADRGYADARTAYIDVLRAWARSADGALSCTAYQAARRREPHWPKRETLAFTFGSWYEALRCAGLEDRAARRPSGV